MSVEKLAYQIPKKTKLANITLNVKNLKQETAFYTELGFKIIKQNQNRVFLSTNGQDPFLLELTQSSQNKQETAGLYHFAVLLPDTKSLADIYDHISQSKKIRLQGASDHGVSQALYLTDPEGNGIEIYSDTKNWNLQDMTVASLNTENLLKQKSEKDWVGFPKNTKLGHIHLQVSDLSRSEIFYGQILGMNNTLSFTGASFFAIGNYHHHIGLNTWSRVKETNGDILGLDFYTLVLPNKSESDKLIENLQRNNIPITEIGESFLIQDPDGLKIQIQYERK